MKKLILTKEERLHIKMFLTAMLFIIYKNLMFDCITFNQIQKKEIVINLLCIMSIYFLIRLFFKKSKFGILIFINIILSILYFSDTVFYREYNDFITLAMVKELNQAGEVSGSIFALTKFKDILYFIDLPFMILLFFKYKKNISFSFKNRLSKFCACIVLFSLSLFAANQRLDGIITVEFSRYEQTKGLGLITMYGVEAYHYLANNINYKPITKDEIKLIQSQLNDSYTVNVNENFRGKNLIVIQVESLQGFALDAKYNNQDVAPNLKKLINESAYFDNCYVQIGLGHTADAELLTNTSMYPLEDSTAYINKANNTYNSIAKSLKSIDYYNMAFHGNQGSFWNRNIMYSTLGFDKFYSLESFKQDDIIWGLSDKSFLKQSAAIINNTNQPFFSFLVTLSSHSPFEIPSYHFTEGKNYMEQYFNAINYTDSAIGDFVDSLRKSGVLDNSILVIYGDHHAIDNDDISNYFHVDMTKDYQQESYVKVPMIIRFPQGKNAGVYHKSVGQNDLFETIRSLYGIQGEKSFGKSMFSQGDNLVVLRNGGYVYGNQYYDSEDKKTYDLKTGAVLKNDSTLIQEAKDQLEASDLIMKYNYFKNNSDK